MYEIITAKVTNTLNGNEGIEVFISNSEEESKEFRDRVNKEVDDWNFPKSTSSGHMSWRSVEFECVKGREIWDEKLCNMHITVRQLFDIFKVELNKNSLF